MVKTTLTLIVVISNLLLLVFLLDLNNKLNYVVTIPTTSLDVKMQQFEKFFHQIPLLDFNTMMAAPNPAISA